MNHRAFAPGADAPRLATFHCSTGTAFEDDVERWINTEAVAWLTDIPYNIFQRRNLELVEGDDGELIAVVAWQDIVRIDLDGIWLELLAVSVDHQHHGAGREVLAHTKARIATLPRDGDVIAGLVHPGNRRSLDMLLADGWVVLGELDGHALMAGRIR